MPTTYRQAAFVRAYLMKLPTTAKAAKLTAIHNCISALAACTPALP